MLPLAALNVSRSDRWDASALGDFVVRYRTRLVLLGTGLLASAIIILSALLAWNTRNALLASAEDSGQMVAKLLARSAGLANEIPGKVEEMLGAQMVAEARITAHFVDAAEKAVRRKIDGVSVTIELGHDDGEQTIHVLNGIIGELHHDRASIEREAVGKCPLRGPILELS